MQGVNYTNKLLRRLTHPLGASQRGKKPSAVGSKIQAKWRVFCSRRNLEDPHLSDAGRIEFLAEILVDSMDSDSQTVHLQLQAMTQPVQRV